LAIETPNAQSSGLATGSTALQIEIPNGLGSEFYPGAPRIYLNDEGAISPRIYSIKSCGVCLCNIDHAAKISVGGAPPAALPDLRTVVDAADGCR
jgi:hypothetical protein